jgi:hypothetical protein
MRAGRNKDGPCFRSGPQSRGAVAGSATEAPPTQSQDDIRRATRLALGLIGSSAHRGLRMRMLNYRSDRPRTVSNAKLDRARFSPVVCRRAAVVLAHLEHLIKLT